MNVNCKMIHRNVCNVKSKKNKNKIEVIKSKVSKYYHHSRHNLQWDNTLGLMLHNTKYVKPKKKYNTCVMVVNERK